MCLHQHTLQVDVACVAGTSNIAGICADTTPPVFMSTPSNISTFTDHAGADSAPANWSAIFATDVIDGSIAAACVPASGSDFSLGTTVSSELLPCYSWLESRTHHDAYQPACQMRFPA